MDEVRATIHERGEGSGREVEIRIMPWGEVADTADGRELFERGAFANVKASRVTLESQRHGGTLVGRGLELDERDDAAYLVGRISETSAGDELLTLIRDGVVTEASVAFVPQKTARRNGVKVRQAVDLRRVAILERGSYQGAEVVAVRGMEEPMDVAEDQVELRSAVERLDDRMARLDDRLGEVAARAAMPAVAAPIEYRARTLGELLMRSWSDQELSRAFGHELAERALADQITTDNPGLVPPGVLSRAATIINRGRPAIDAQGTGSLPSSGMTVNWPVLTTPLTGLIAKQTAEKAAVVSAKVSFGNASAPISTFAGASDVSYQLIRRSEPPYLEAYGRAMLAAWSHVTDTQYTVDVLAAGTSTQVMTPAMTSAQIISALVDASIKVAAATGQPASTVVVAADLFAAIAKVFAPTSVNPTSVGGTAMASTLQVNASGLRITLDPFLAAGTGWISNSLATEWLEDGPFTITVDDAEKIGQNVAYWSLGVSAVYIPAGVVKIVAV